MYKDALGASADVEVVRGVLLYMTYGDSRISPSLMLVSCSANTSTWCLCRCCLKSFIRLRRPLTFHWIIDGMRFVLEGHGSLFLVTCIFPLFWADFSPMQSNDTRR